MHVKVGQSWDEIATASIDSPCVTRHLHARARTQRYDFAIANEDDLIGEGTLAIHRDHVHVLNSDGLECK